MSHNLDTLRRNDEYSTECCIYIECLVLLKQKETGNSTENPTSNFVSVKMDFHFYSEFKAAMQFLLKYSSGKKIPNQ